MSSLSLAYLSLPLPCPESIFTLSWRHQAGHDDAMDGCERDRSDGFSVSEG